MKKLLFSLSLLLMSSALLNAQVTFTPVSGSQWSSGQGYTKLFDDTYLKWGSTLNGGGAWFIFKASESVILSGYTMITGDDNASWNGRNPRKWSIYGINSVSDPAKDDGGWQLIVSQEDDPEMEDKNYKAYHFDIPANEKSYQYYKVLITTVYSGNDVQLCEFLPETKISEIDVTADDVTYNGGTGNTGNPYSKAVDNNTSSNWSAYTWDGNWILFDTGSSNTVLKSYTLTTASDAGTYTNRTPVSWTWYGSNKDDGQPGKDDGWQEIGKVSRDLTLFNRKASKVSQVYTIANNTAYRYYKFVINECDPDGTEDLGGQWGGMFSLSEISLNPACSHSYGTFSLCYYMVGKGVFEQTNVCEYCGKTNVSSQVSTISIKDGKTFKGNSAISGVSISYSRTISSDMGTVCLPYALDVSQKSNNAKYYTLGRYDDVNDVLLFDEVTSTLPAYTPAIYIRVGATTTLDLSMSGTVMSSALNNNVTTNAARDANWSMVGTIKNGTASESGNSIYYLKGGSFHRCNDYITYKPYRAYITGPNVGASVKAFNIWDDTEDALNSVISEQSGEMQLYDLNGRKVKDVRNGQVYILNGRKVMFNK